MSDETRGEREADIAQRTRELLTAAVQRFGSQVGVMESYPTITCGTFTVASRFRTDLIMAPCLQPGFDPSLCTVLLSGGVDSSVAASLAYSLLGVRHAIRYIQPPITYIQPSITYTPRADNGR